MYGLRLVPFSLFVVLNTLDGTAGCTWLLCVSGFGYFVVVLLGVYIWAQDWSSVPCSFEYFKWDCWIYVVWYCCSILYFVVSIFCGGTSWCVVWDWYCVLCLYVYIICGRTIDFVWSVNCALFSVYRFGYFVVGLLGVCALGLVLGLMYCCFKLNRSMKMTTHTRARRLDERNGGSTSFNKQVTFKSTHT